MSSRVAKWWLSDSRKSLRRTSQKTRDGIACQEKHNPLAKPVTRPLSLQSAGNAWQQWADTPTLQLAHREFEHALNCRCIPLRSNCALQLQSTSTRLVLGACLHVEAHLHNVDPPHKGGNLIVARQLCAALPQRTAPSEPSARGNASALEVLSD